MGLSLEWLIRYLLEFFKDHLTDSETARLGKMLINMSKANQISQIVASSIVFLAIYSVLIVVWKNGSFKNFPRRVKIALICYAIQAPYTCGLAIAIWVKEGYMAPFLYREPMWRCLFTLS